MIVEKNVDGEWESLPAHLWVVTKARARDGLPPMKIVPAEYGLVMGVPTFIKERFNGSGKKLVNHLIDDCHKTYGTAILAAGAIATQELEIEQSKFKKRAARLRISILATRKHCRQEKYGKP
jgi:hypothetical protein